MGPLGEVLRKLSLGGGGGGELFNLSVWRDDLTADLKSDPLNMNNRQSLT